MAVKYTLGGATPDELDTDALLRSLSALNLAALPHRWKACQAVLAAVISTSSGLGDSHLWAYGLHLALAGHEEPLDMGSSNPVIKGYRAGAELLPLTSPLVLDWPLGQRRQIGSQSPGRSWLN
jgi:hypothetical protein